MKVKIEIFNNSASKKGLSPNLKIGLSQPTKLPNQINPKR